MFILPELKMSVLVSELQRGSYRAIGTMLSVCLVHGGVGPYVFSERLICQLTGQSTPLGQMTELDDDDLRAGLEKAGFTKSKWGIC